MSGLLNAVIRLLGKTIYRLGGARVLIGLTKNRPRVLLYHASEPTEGPFIRGARCNTPPGCLDRQLAFLRRYYVLTDLEHALAEDRPARAVAITFDDGYRSVYRYALPVLLRHGATATIYLVGSAIGDSALVWVNAVNWMLQERPALGAIAAARANATPGPELLDHVIARLEPADARRVTSDMAEHGAVELGPLATEAELFLTEEQIAEMAAHGFTFGNHTLTHPNLARAPAAEAREEIRCAHERLSGLPGFVASFAYPFGYTSPDALEEAHALGYASVVEVGGTNARLDRMAVARQPVSDQTPAELFADMEVVEPLKAWLRRRAGPWGYSKVPSPGQTRRS